MNNLLYKFEKPANEAILSYTAGSKERKLLEAELTRQSNETIEIPVIINGEKIFTGNVGKIYMPHNKNHVLATYHLAGEKEAKMAIEAAMEAHLKWENTPWVERISIFLKIAELIAKKHRHLINASTMLGQSKNAFQAEIDAACESIDFIKFNAYYVSQIYNDQPLSDNGIINRIEYRPLEGFVLAISPFNFTSIALNLALAPAIMGNTVIWKPATTALLSNYYLMQIYEEAGLPAGVINFLPSSGQLVSNEIIPDKNLAGIHFTGSTETFNNIWQQAAVNLKSYVSYPRLVGETGGKDFIMVHSSANADEVSTAMVRGAFEYQGQKCSAASRAYIPESLWPLVKEKMLSMMDQIKMGSVDNFENFVNAVIDEKSYNRICSYIDKAKASPEAEILHGGTCNNENGYFISPTVILTKNPHFVTMEEEIFGPVLTVFVYPDNDFEATLALCNKTSPYALTGSIFSNDRQATILATQILKFAAGNLYINDKPTGAVVGQQPFGGARASGTNDKAGSYLNLLRWTNPRTIKETLLPPTDFKYPFMKTGSCEKK